MFAVFVTLCFFFAATESITNHPLMMVLSFDGFRPDYINPKRTPNLAQLRKTGTSPKFMDSTFPSNTFVNHFSVATGLYAEEHGVIDDEIFDRNYKILKYSYELFHYDESIVPIWTQNENTGNERYSGVMMWPGGEFPYQGKKPTYYEKLDVKLAWNYRIDIMMSWITDKDKPANLVLGYFEGPGYTARRNGVWSNEVIEQIKRVDNTIKYLLDSIKANKLENILNLIILSDHGITTITYDDMVFLDNYVSNSLYESIHNGPNVLIYPKPGKMEEVYNSLEKGSTESSRFKVYKPEDLPCSWHINMSPRLKGLIYVSAKEGYSIWDNHIKANSLRKLLQEKGKKEFKIGCHGYDSKHPEMGALFIGSGPIFKKHFTPLPFDNIIMYALISYVMELDKPASSVQPHGSTCDVTNLLSSEFMTGSNSNVQESPTKVSVYGGYGLWCYFSLYTIVIVFGNEIVN